MAKRTGETRSGSKVTKTTSIKMATRASKRFAKRQKLPFEPNNGEVAPF